MWTDVEGLGQYLPESSDIVPCFSGEVGVVVILVSFYPSELYQVGSKGRSCLMNLFYQIPVWGECGIWINSLVWPALVHPLY